METKTEFFIMGLMVRLTANSDLSPMQSIQVYRAVCDAIVHHTSKTGETYFTVDLTMFLETLKELDLYGMDADALIDICLGI